jgi:hypothetical protein
MVCTFVLVSLLSSSQAIGDCAWVMWIKHHEVQLNDGREKVWWEIETAIPRYDQCVQVKQDIWNKQGRRGK